MLYLLAVLSILCGFFRPDAAYYQPPKIVKIGVEDIRSWGYDETSICTIINSTRSSQYSVDRLHDLCLQQRNLPPTTGRPPYQHGMEGLFYGSRMYREVCNEDVPLAERGFDEVVEGFENGSKNKQLLEVFLELSARNMSIVSIGDSINNQVFNFPLYTTVIWFVIRMVIVMCLNLLIVSRGHAL